MRPNQQFVLKKNPTQCSTSASGQISLRIFCYKLCNPNMQNLSICQLEYSICVTYYWIFIELCPIIQQKHRRTDAPTYSRRRINNIFYKPVKIILCIWRVGNRIFHFIFGIFVSMSKPRSLYVVSM